MLHWSQIIDNELGVRFKIYTTSRSSAFVYPKMVSERVAQKVGMSVSSLFSQLRVAASSSKEQLQPHEHRIHNITTTR